MTDLDFNGLVVYLVGYLVFWVWSLTVIARLRGVIRLHDIGWAFITSLIWFLLLLVGLWETMPRLPDIGNKVIWRRENRGPHSS